MKKLNLNCEAVQERSQKEVAFNANVMTVIGESKLGALLPIIKETTYDNDVKSMHSVIEGKYTDMINKRYCVMAVPLYGTFGDYRTEDDVFDCIINMMGYTSKKLNIDIPMPDSYHYIDSYDNVCYMALVFEYKE